MNIASKRAALIAILLFAIAPYFIGLGASTLWDSNEAFYAETPRVMVETGDYINPAFNNQPRFNKPPLSYWIVAAFYKTFGVSEFSERLPIALAALTMLVAAFIIARETHSLEAGLFAALALAASPRVLMFSRRIMIDLYVAMFMSAALMFFILARTRPDRRRTFLVLMYVSVGLGVLTKGPVAAALPALALLIYLATTRQLRRLGEMMLPLGVVIVAIIVLPWYAAIYERHGWGYIESFILRDNISRFTEPVWGPRRSIFFYLPVFAGDLFPWSVFLVAALWPGVKKIAAKFRRIQTDESQNEDASTQRIELLPVIWLMVIVAFFSVSRNKEDLYILPAYPAAAAVVGALLARLDFHRKTINATTCLLGSITAIAGAAVLYAFNSEAMPYRIAGATAIGATLLAGGLIVVTLVVMKKQFAALAASLLAVIVGNYFFVVAALPDFERYKPVRPFCEVIAGQASEDALIGYFRLASPSMTFYLRRQIFEYYEEDELRRALSSGREVYCLMTQADYQQMKDTLPAPTYVLAVRPLFQVKLKTILERKEIPQAVLISNRDQTGVSR